MNNAAQTAAIREAQGTAWMTYVRALSDLGAQHPTTDLCRETHIRLVDQANASAAGKPLPKPTRPDFGTLFGFRRSRR